MAANAVNNFMNSGSIRIAREQAGIRSDLAQFSFEEYLQNLLIEQRKKEIEFHENLGFAIKTGERSSGKAMTERQRIYFVDDIALIPLRPDEEPEILKVVEDKLFAAVLRKHGRSVTDEKYDEAPGELAAKFGGEEDPALSSSYFGWLETFGQEPEFNSDAEEDLYFDPDADMELAMSDDMHHELLRLGSDWQPPEIV